MCGITGFYSHNKDFSKNDLEKMTSCLKHRGPDAAGYFFNEVCGLGNRRLKVIDLSDTANQPFYSHDGRYVMVYNGEVYNYAEIAAELKAKANIRFKTTSDTEVILEAYAYYGINFIEKLNGMFAMAIYDKQTDELVVFRDRLGIKPLYYYWRNGDLVFASELKAIKTFNQLSFEIDHSAIFAYLHLGYIPAPFSIYKEVKKLNAGTYLKLSKNELNVVQYWDTYSKISNETLHDERVAMEQFEYLMKTSVQYQMKSDVPIGVFLSGGVDSSLVAAMASSQSSNKVKTFSIGFREQEFNEAEYARKVASHLETEHHEFIISYEDALPLVDKMTGVYDEPYADSSAIPTMLVSKMAVNHVTVTLSGDGADELFCGYGAYKWANTLNNPLFKLFHKPFASVLRTFSSARYRKASALFNYHDYNTIQSHIFSQEQLLFSASETSFMLHHPDITANLQRPITNNRRLTPAEQQAVFDINYYLKEDLLTKVDRAAMLYSLETRVPYLDHRIVEFALNLSPELKCKNKSTKYLLKKLLYKYVPVEFFERRKQGFSIPLSLWLQNELRYLIDDYLKKNVVEQYEIVKYEEVSQLKEKFNSGETHLYNKLWLLIILHKWLAGNQ